MLRPVKMKVLEVLAKFHGRVPSSFPDLYDEALRDQEERAGRRVAARAPTMAEASAPSRAKSCSSSHIWGRGQGTLFPLCWKRAVKLLNSA